MSKANAFELDWLEHFFQNAAIAGVGDGTGLPAASTAGSLYISLHSADPGETGTQVTSEQAYSGYARVAVARNNTAWVITTAPQGLVKPCADLPPIMHYRGFEAREFPAVEVNATYYRLPPPSTLAAMERKTPPNFEFVVKAHHDMTHERSLDPEMFRAFSRAIEPVRAAGKLHGLLAQFPYAFRRTPENESYVVELKRRLPEGVPLFVEYRHNSWIRDDVFPWMEREGLGYVSVDEPDLPGLVPPIARATGDVGYVRFHGRNRVNWWRGEGAVRARPAAGATAGATRKS